MRIFVALALLFAVTGFAHSSVYGSWSNSSGGLYGTAAAPVSDAERATRIQPTVLAQAKKKGGRNVCDANFRFCSAQCKKEPPTERPFCQERCANDHFWCVSVCHGIPC